MPERAMTLAETPPEEQHTGTRGGPAGVLGPSQRPASLDEAFHTLADDAPYGELHRALVRRFAESDAEVWAHLVGGGARAAPPPVVTVP